MCSNHEEKSFQSQKIPLRFLVNMLSEYDDAFEEMSEFEKLLDLKSKNILCSDSKCGSHNKHDIKEKFHFESFLDHLEEKNRRSIQKNKLRSKSIGIVESIKQEVKEENSEDEDSISRRKSLLPPLKNIAHMFESPNASHSTSKNKLQSIENPDNQKNEEKINISHEPQAESHQIQNIPPPSKMPFQCSVEALLMQRQVNAEDILISLGFGPPQEQSLASRLPLRFLKDSAQAAGISISEYIRRHPTLHEGYYSHHSMDSFPFEH